MASKFSQVKIRDNFNIEAERMGLFGGLSIKFSRLASWRLQFSKGKQILNVVEFYRKVFGLLPLQLMVYRSSIFDPQQTTSSSTNPKAPPLSNVATPTSLPADPFEYYDAGNHWCQKCNVTSGSMFDFFTHCHSKTHRKVCSCKSHQRRLFSLCSETTASVTPVHPFVCPCLHAEFSGSSHSLLTLTTDPGLPLPPKLSIGPVQKRGCPSPLKVNFLYGDAMLFTDHPGV